MLRGVRIVSQQGIQAHDNSGRAETALAAMRFGHAFLRGMRALCVANALNGDDMFAVETYKRCETGIDTRVIDFLGGGVVLAHNNCASTAPTFAAATIN